MKNMTITKAVSLILCFAMLLAVLPVTAIAVESGEPLSATSASAVQYIDANGETQECTNYTVLDDNYFTENNHILTTGWYYVGKEMQAEERLTVNGDVHIILRNILRAEQGICVEGDNSISIYTVPGNSLGGLYVNFTQRISEGHAGIGSNADSSNSCGNITINGCTVDVYGGNDDNFVGAAIGAGANGLFGGNVTINGGKIKAFGGYSTGRFVSIGGCGIGGGAGFAGSGLESITINGGEIYAYGMYGSAAIGAAANAQPGEGSPAVSITINGGTVYPFAVEIPKNDIEVTIPENSWASNGVAIGSGINGVCGDITINGGQIGDSGLSNARGIVGIGKGDDENARCGDITVSGGKINVGAAKYGFSGNVTVNGGNITSAGATHGFYAAEGEAVQINGGTVVASGIGVGAFSKTPGLKTLSATEAPWEVGYLEDPTRVLEEWIQKTYPADESFDASIYTAKKYVRVRKLIDYLEYDTESGEFNEVYLGTTPVTEITSTNNSIKLDDGFYKVRANAQFSLDYIIVKEGATAKLILTDSSILTINRLYTLPNATLIIYGQAEGTGKLIINESTCAPGSKIFIHGGKVDATNGFYAQDFSFQLTVYGGEVSATGADETDDTQSTIHNDGIRGDVTVYGGKLTAVGGKGKDGADNSTPSSGTDTSGTQGGYGILGNVTVHGGEVTITGGTGGKGGKCVGGGKGGNGGIGLYGSITLTGGKVTVNGGDGGQGSDGDQIDSGSSPLPGSTSNAPGVGGDGGSGIFLKYDASSVKGGILTVHAGEHGANGAGGDIANATHGESNGITAESQIEPQFNVSGGSVYIYGGECSVGLGNTEAPSIPVDISGGNMYVYGGAGMAAIIAVVNVSGGTLTATGGNGDDTNKNGGDGMSGSLTVSGGTVNAAGGKGAEGGSGGNGISAGVNIKNGEVNAIGGDATQSGLPVSASSPCVGGYGIYGNTRISGGYTTAKGGFTKNVNVDEYQKAFYQQPDISGNCKVTADGTEIPSYISFTDFSNIIISYGELTQYIYYDETEKTFKSATAYAQKFDGESASSLASGWYYIDGEVTRENAISVDGDVHIILKDSSHLIAQNGIDARPNEYQGTTLSLYIYAQSQVTVVNTDGVYTVSEGCKAGKITAKISSQNMNSAAIGASSSYSSSPITIHGGIIDAQGGSYAAGIGGGWNGSGNNITINGGYINAKGGTNAAGIGGGIGGSTDNITVNGGTVIATGGDVEYDNGGAGIGSTGTIGNITINGGTVIATGAKNAAGIGGANTGHLENAGVDYTGIVINGGKVIATGGENAPGIGNGGNAIPNLTSSVEGKITVKGGTVTSIGGKGHVGIELNSSVTDTSLNYTATIKLDVQSTAGSVTAVGGENANAFDICPFDNAQAPGYDVRVGNDPTNLLLYTQSSYKTRSAETFTGNRFAQIVPCNSHKKAFVFTYDENGKADVEMHDEMCDFCGLALGTSSSHTFDATTHMCACGGIGEFKYLEYDAVQKKFVEKTEVAVVFDPEHGACAYTTDTKTIRYAVIGEVDYKDVDGHYLPLQIAGGANDFELHLILTDKCMLYVQNIPVEQTQSVSIYAQSHPILDINNNVMTTSKTGKLTTVPNNMNVDYFAAGIGEYYTGYGSENYHPSGKITIHGGVISTRGSSAPGNYTVGIGGDCTSSNMNNNVAIHGGHTTVWATGNHSGIHARTFTMTGGYLNTTGSTGGSGIATPSVDKSVTISGGTLIATGGDNGGHGIYGGTSSGEVVTISDGTVRASGGTDGNGILAGSITVSGGMVTALGNGKGYGIAINDPGDINATSKPFEIKGGSLMILGGNHESVRGTSGIYGISSIKLYAGCSFSVNTGSWGKQHECASETTYETANRDEGSPFGDNYIGLWVYPIDSSSTGTSVLNINVDVSWTNMAFKFENGKWSPVNSDGGVITVKNNSQATIKFNASFTKTDNAEVAQGIVTVNGSLGAEVDVDANTTSTKKLTLSGEPNLALSNASIGTVEVFISTNQLSGGTNAYSGEIQIGSDWYYFENGIVRTNFWLGDRYFGSDGKRYTGMQSVDGVSYYFDPSSGNFWRGDGKNVLAVVIENKVYFFDHEGKQILYGEGFREVTFNVYKHNYMGAIGDVLVGDYKKTFYFEPDGGAFVGGFFYIDEYAIRGTYYADIENGLYSGWKEIDGEKYYFAQRYGEFVGQTFKYYSIEDKYLTNFEMCQSGEFYIDNEYYLFDDDGKMVKDCDVTAVVEENGKQVTHVYHYDADGKKHFGWYSPDETTTYLCYDVERGNYVRTGFMWYCGEKFYFNEDYSIYANGWLDVDGYRYYCIQRGHHYHTPGYILRDGKFIENAHYIFDGEGRMQTGWITKGDQKHYLGPDGIAPSGWLDVDGATYYFREWGIPSVGWVDDTPQFSSKRYFLFGGDGKMQTGWTEHDGKWFYLAPTSSWNCSRGQVFYGFVNIDGYDYHLNTSNYHPGTLGYVHSGFFKSDIFVQDEFADYYYTLTPDQAEPKLGIEIPNGASTSDPRYYTVGTVFKNGTQIIDGKEYYFDADGKWDKNYNSN